MTRRDTTTHDTRPEQAPTDDTGPAEVWPGEIRPRAGQHAGPPRLAVSVDNNHCQLYGICEQEAPQVFALGVDGRLRYDPRPSSAHTAGVRQAARCCPMQAITVTDRR